MSCVKHARHSLGTIIFMTAVGTWQRAIHYTPIFITRLWKLKPSKHIKKPKEKKLIACRCCQHQKNAYSLCSLFSCLYWDLLFCGTHRPRIGRTQSQTSQNAKTTGPCDGRPTRFYGPAWVQHWVLQNPIKFGQASVPTRQCLWRHGIDRQRSETLVWMVGLPGRGPVVSLPLGLLNKIQNVSNT